MEWDELKAGGSEHYKTGSVEPIDLYKAGGIFKDFAIGSIIKYAFRSRTEMNVDEVTFRKNMEKVIHYASLLIADK